MVSKHYHGQDAVSDWADIILEYFNMRIWTTALHENFLKCADCQTV